MSNNVAVRLRHNRLSLPRRLIDLGAAGNLSGLNLENGKQISVQGPRIPVNDCTLCLAPRVGQGDKSLQVNRQPTNREQSVSHRWS